MILYFTGTGNSEYVAKRIAKELDEEAVDLFDRIRNKDYSALESNSPWIIVTPTYAWRIPRIVEEWVAKTSLLGNNKIYFIMTCGGNISNAEKYLAKLCKAKSLELLGCAEIIMPENYITMFSAPSKEEALQIIDRAESCIEKIAYLIRNGECIPQNKITLTDRINSGIVNDLFYPFFVHDKYFIAKENCISCGKCVNVCPLNNIELVKGKPKWKGNCTQCMACIGKCPVSAIEYGNKSKGKVRYTCPK